MIPSDTSRPVFRVRCFQPLSHLSNRLSSYVFRLARASRIRACYRKCYPKQLGLAVAPSFSRLVRDIKLFRSLGLHGLGHVAVQVYGRGDG